MEIERLKDPFPASDIEWRPQGSLGRDGKIGVVAYVDARAVMNRLDEVCGPENWRVRYVHEGAGVMCCLAIRVDRPEIGEAYWVEKWDGAEETLIEKFKGGISGALKRAANVWGIGRYLYSLERTRTPARQTKPGEQTPAGWNWTKDFIYQVPRLPDWALPGDSPGQLKGPEPAPERRPDITLASGAQTQRIGILRHEGDVPEPQYRDWLRTRYGVESAKDLTKEQASELIEKLEKRNRARTQDDAKEAFGNPEFEELREILTAYVKRLETWKDLSPRTKRRLEYKDRYEVDIQTAGELKALLPHMADEDEMKGLIDKLDKLFEDETF